jgi:hypothetical protein
MEYFAQEIEKNRITNIYYFKNQTSYVNEFSLSEKHVIAKILKA